MRLDLSELTVTLLARLWWFITHRWTRYVVAWLLVLGLAAKAQYKALHIFDERATEPEKRRRDGNGGHTAIDFGGQWLMGRMLVTGHGRQLYDRHVLRQIAEEAYRRENEAPQPNRHDADEMLSAFMDAEAGPGGYSAREGNERETMQSFLLPLGTVGPLEAVASAAAAQSAYWQPERTGELQRRHVGGPLYPPTQALILAPLARQNDPQRAYFTMLWIMLACGFLGGLGVSVLTHGRIWWPVATALILSYPGFTGGHELGQNAAASLMLVIWGWALMARGYDSGGGLIWGLLAFKPVWAAAFFLVPLLTRRWRACAVMIAVGAVMVAATLPFVGIETWRDWLKVGRAANMTYNVDGNWIPLSRDLLGIPRRFLIDTNDPNTKYFERDRWYAHVAGWALWLVVVELTVRLSQMWPKTFRPATGAAAAFLLLGAWMSCFHFMYYDALLSAVAVFAVLDPPRALFRPRLITFQGAEESSGLDAAALDYFRPRLAQTHPGLSGTGVGRTWVANSFLMYFTIVLIVVQFTLPWLDLGMTVTGRHGGLAPQAVSSAGEVLVQEGKVVMHTPKIEITTTTAGPPWDTYCLMFLWAWCGVRVVMGRREPGILLADAGKRTAR